MAQKWSDESYMPTCMGKYLDRWGVLGVVPSYGARYVAGWVAVDQTGFRKSRAKCEAHRILRRAKPLSYAAYRNADGFGRNPTGKKASFSPSTEIKTRTCP